MKRQTPTTPADLERLSDISGEPIEFDYHRGRAYIELDRETVWAPIPEVAA